MQDLQESSLRDRKRRATRARIERAAVEIVFEGGLSALTIEAVSTRAEISPRTFFNYFDSKEDAILGIPIGDDAGRAIEAAASELQPATLREGVLQLLTLPLEDGVYDRELNARRRKVVHEHPELLRRRFMKMGSMIGALTKGVRILMARMVPPGTPPPQCDDAQAQVVALMGAAAVHAAFVEFATEHETSAGEDAARLIRERASGLLTQTMETLR